ncbi:hypothetical protein PBR_1006 [Segatella baroniae B14]|uniref:Uncharacterized protein n=1 Tax=Segatella baroniae B14 TaxID=752555 RepID=D8DXF6_9BACT|nr:hypothetical protein PBR_1006 [Segatella baroniae B14]
MIAVVSTAGAVVVVAICFVLQLLMVKTIIAAATRLNIFFIVYKFNFDGKVTTNN